MRISHIVLVAFLVSACAVGIEPPETTEMISITENLTYEFGTTIQCRDGESVTCEAEKDIPPAYPTVELELTPFSIDVHEVTNLQYEYCVANDACTAPKFGNASTIIEYYGTDQYASYPVVNVTHEQAAQYCAFVGKRLPTEYEWERVAKGADPENPRIYPSDSFPASLGSCTSGVALKLCGGSVRPEPVASSSQDMVSETTGQVYDLAGNVTEWTSSYFEGSTINQQMNWVTCKELLPKECNCFNCPPGPDQAFCLTQCGNCSECDDGGGVVPLCFFLCDGVNAVGRVPVCKPYSEGEVVVPEEIWPTSGGEVLTRGGNYSTPQQQACGVRSADRTFVRSAGDDGSSPVVGFRCAKDN